MLLVSCGGGGGGEKPVTVTPIPQVTLTSSASEILVGNSVTLTWSSSNSTSCSASGAWSGSKGLSGSESISVDSATVFNYTLDCIGAGGSTSRSISVLGYQEITGVSVDGYIRSADVFIDENDNFEPDADEAATVSSDDGTFSLRYSQGNLVSLGGFDLDSGNSLDNLLILNKLDSYASFAAITPITTVIAFMQVPIDIHTILGIDPSIDISSTDPVAALGDGGIYDHLYEKGNQVTILVLALQNVSNDLNSTQDNSRDYFQSFTEELESDFADNGVEVNIETDNFIEKVLANVVGVKKLTIDQDDMANIIDVLASVMPIIQVKEETALNNALFGFGTSTLQADMSAIAQGTVTDEILNNYKSNVIEYIAQDQNVDPGGLTPNVIASPDNVSLSEDSSESIPILANDSYTTAAPLTVTIGEPKSGVAIYGGGVVTYTPASDFNGQDSFEYTIAQNDKSSTALVTAQIAMVNDAPAFNNLLTSYSVPENQLAVLTVLGTDVENDPLTVSLAGADAVNFDLSDSGILTFIAPPDFELKQRYDITLTISDGQESMSQDVIINVTNVDDVAPEFNSTMIFSAAENQTSIGKVVATDIDSTALTYTVSGSELSITSDGILTFLSAPDYETRSSYKANVTVTDGYQEAAGLITINITDENDLIEGYVIKGPVKKATVFLDYNGNGSLDTSEPYTQTAPNGAYALTTTSDAPANFDIVAILGDESVDSSTGQSYADSGVKLRAPSNAKVITPLTTLFEEIKDNLVKEEALAAGDFNALLGLPANVDITQFNPFHIDAEPSLALAVEVTGHQVITALTVTTQVLGGIVSDGGGTLSAEESFSITLRSFAQSVIASSNKVSVDQASRAAAGESNGDAVESGVAALLAGQIAALKAELISILEKAGGVADADTGAIADYLLDQSTDMVTTVVDALYGLTVDEFNTSASGAVFTVRDSAMEQILALAEDVIATVDAGEPLESYDPTLILTLNSLEAVATLAGENELAVQKYTAQNDSTAPVISLNGEYSIVMELDDTYLEQGASAVDDNDADVEVNITGTVKNEPGTYKMTYFATDTAGNYATMERIINVRAPTNDVAPIFTSPKIYSAAENQKAIGTVTAKDEDGNKVAYSISDSTPESGLEITAAGILSFVAAPDYEAKTSYTATVQATDGPHSTTHEITVNVTDVNDVTPTFTSSVTFSAEENQILIGTVTAVDSDSRLITFSIPDSEFLTISLSGVLRFKSAPDYENSSPAATTVTASDGVYTVTQDIIVYVTDADEINPSITVSSVATSINEGDTALGSVSADESVTWSVFGDGVAIGVDSGVINLDVPADYEVVMSHSFTVTATDAVGNTATTGPLTVNVTDADEIKPVITTAVKTFIAEGDTVLGSVSANETVTWSIFGNGVAIDVDSGEITLDAPADYETATSHSFTVTATDEAYNTSTVTPTVIVRADTNTDNTAPVINRSLLLASINEGDISLGKVSANESVTWSISGSGVSINSAGDIALDAAADYETAISYSFSVKAIDSVGNDSLIEVLVEVIDENDNSPVFSSSNTFTAPENQTSIGTVTATDADTTDLVTFTVSGDELQITLGGVLSFNEGPDYETKSLYTATVTASDNTNTTTQAITVIVTDVSDGTLAGRTLQVGSGTRNISKAPFNGIYDYSQMGFIALASEIEEVANTRSGVEGVILSLAFEYGGWARDYSVGLQTLTLSHVAEKTFEGPSHSTDYRGLSLRDTTTVKANFDFEIKNNGWIETRFQEPFVWNGTDNILISWENRDGTYANGYGWLEGESGYPGRLAQGSSDDVYPTIVTPSSYRPNIRFEFDLPRPVFTSPSTFSAAENQTLIGTVRATDTDGDTVIFSISGSELAITSTGVLTFLSVPDYETKSSYTATVTASDGTYTAEQVITVNVTDVNDAPIFTSGSTFSAAENQTAIGTVTATDADSGDSVTFTVSGSELMITSVGVLTFVSAPDYETKATYTATVTATDGTDTTTQSITVNVTDVNDNPPAFTSGATFNALENQLAIGTVTATVDRGSLSFSVSGSELLITSTGVLSFAVAPDYEAKSTYIATVTASDGTLSTTQDITVNVTNVNDNLPVFTSGATFSAAENQTAIGTVSATDGDGDTITFTVSGSEFVITSGGVLSFVSVPAYETKSSYPATVTASDGTNVATQDITVTVTGSLNDFITGSDDADDIKTYGGDDTISGIGEGDFVDAGAGDDTVILGAIR